MTTINLGIIGGGQLGSLLAVAAKKLKIKTTIFCDDINAPAKNYCDEFIFGDYKDDKIIEGNPDKIKFVTDNWKFTKNIKQKGPNWYLSEIISK